MATQIRGLMQLQHVAHELEKKYGTLPFAIELVKSRNDLSALLFDAKGRICQERRQIVLELASTLKHKRLKEIISNREELTRLEYPIEVHPSMKHFGPPAKACLEVISSLEGRSDLHFIPTKYMIDKIMEFLCTGLMKVDDVQIKIEELKLSTLQEIFLYFVRFHDANYGEAYNRKEFIDDLERVLPNASFIAEVKKRFFFEEHHVGIVTPFFFVDGRYCRLSSFAAVQRAFSLMALEVKAPLQDEISATSFRLFLAKYCKMHYKQFTEEAILKHGRFQLPSYSESGILALCKNLGYEVKEELFEASSPMLFLRRLNSLVKNRGVEKVYFLGGPLFEMDQAVLFAYPPKEFFDSFHKKMQKPANRQFVEQISLLKGTLNQIVPRDDLPDKLTGTPFEISAKLCRDENILKVLNQVERRMNRPLTLGIARYGDGSYLVCHMDFESGNPMLYKLSTKEMKPVNFSQFKLARVLLQAYPYFEKPKPRKV